MLIAWMLAGALAPAQAEDAAGDTAATTVTAAPAEWRGAIEAGGLRRAEIGGSARFGEVELPATLQLQCHPGSDGALVWRLKVGGTDALAEFGLDDFEGPDAVAAGERLSMLALEGGLLQPRVETATAGYYADASTFAFEFAAPANAASQGALLADSIGPQTRTLRWVVHSYRDRARMLAASFAAARGLAAVRDTMMGCGPPPALGPEQFAAWLGRNPAAVSLWSQRPIEWRLRALLGADYDAVRARLARAEPLGETDGVYFVLAPDRDDERSGAVVQFSAGGDGEVIVIDAGQVTRYVLRSGAIDPPPAVREFIGARAGDR
jgi:hypothetical protein